MRNRKSYFILFAFFIFAATACTKKAPESSAAVSFQFDKETFQSIQSKSLSSASAGNTGPGWGQAPITSYSEIDCFGVMVHADEPNMRESSCLLGDGQRFHFGESRVGFFGFDSKQTINVTPGPDRTFFVIGLSSANGQCEPGLGSADPNFNFSNYSPPYLIGKAVTKLEAGVNPPVGIQLVDSFSTANQLTTCDFFRPDDSDDGNSGSLALFIPGSFRDQWVDDNTLPRTVTYPVGSYSHAECSKDGVNFTSCPVGSMTWEWADRTLQHTIRAYTGSDYDEVVFRPDDYYSSVVPINCTHQVSGTSTFDDTFLNAGLGADNNVICFDDNTTLTPGSITSIDITNNNITLVVRQGHHATLQQTGEDNLVSVSGQGAVIMGFDILSSATSGGFSAIQSNAAQGVRVIDNHIEVTSAGSYAVPLLFDAGSGTTTPNYTRHNLIIGPMFGVKADAGGIGIVEDSVVRGTGTNATQHRIVVVNDGGSSLTINDSLLAVNVGTAVQLEGGSATGATFEMNRTKAIRNASGAGTNSSPFLAANLASSIGGENFNSPDHGNYLCNENPGNRHFATVTNGGTSGGTWTATSEIQNFVSLNAEACPAAIINERDQFDPFAPF